MPTRNINLTDHFDRLIEKCVSSGQYGNASEMVREGLRLIEQRDKEHKERIRRLRADIQVGIDQLDRGEGIYFESMDDLEAYIDQIGEEVSTELSHEKSRA